MAEPAVVDECLRQERDGFPEEPAASDPARRADGVRRLFDSAHALTQARIVDFAERAERKGAVARRLRIAAFSSFILGGLALALARPLEALRDGRASGPNPKILEGVWEMLATDPRTAIGYALLALAGALALYDQLFGASRSWMRARQAQTRLEALAVSLRYAWAARLAKSGGAVSDAATVKDLADLILNHVTALEALSEAETGAPVEQFRAQLDSFGRELNLTDVAAQAQHPA